jgi:diaminopimelate epimerase
MDDLKVSTKAHTRVGSAASKLGATLPFAKMNALGNDFVLLSEKDLQQEAQGRALLADWQLGGPKLARILCDRHFGIGADGLILVKSSQNADCKLAWSYINSDGSPSKMCGNGVRCLALYALEAGMIEAGEFLLATDAGPVKIRIESSDCIESDLGEPILESSQIPVSGPSRARVLNHELEVEGHRFAVFCISMGNPHCVIFDSKLSSAEQEQLASKIQALPFFPEGVNVEFVEVENPAYAKVFVVERGCGPTLACASGAAAVLVAGVLSGRLERHAKIMLPGGELSVSWSDKDNRVRLSGPARVSFRGVVDLSLLKGASA